MSEPIDNKVSQILRKKFEDDQIGKLPKVSCRKCSDAGEGCGKKEWDGSEHRMVRCPDCKAWITSAHVHIEYVGHAEVTSRLLDADPEWTWRPMAFGADGLPAFDRNGGLWVYLTVGGVERPGYGDGGGKNGANAVKEAIGDALRNSGMRFGVALNQWAKSDIHAERAPEPEDFSATSEQINSILIKLTQVRQVRDRNTIRKALRVIIGHPIDAPAELTSAEADLVLSQLREEESKLPPQPTPTQAVLSVMTGGNGPQSSTEEDS